MIISIFASIGAQNLGDELILKNEIKILEEKYGKDTKFVVFTYDLKDIFLKKSNIEYREYFPIGVKNPKNILRNIFNFLSFLSVVIKSDLIIIGGGGIIYDSEKQVTKNPLDQRLFRTNIFRFLNKKFSFFAVGVNIKNKDNFTKIKKIFYKSVDNTVRGKYSFNLLKDLGIKSNLVKDPVFNDVKDLSLENKFMISRVKSYDFSYKDLENIDLDGKKIALAFRQGYLSDNNINISSQLEEGKINEIINYILGKGGEVILLPHSFHKTDDIANDYKFLSKFLRINEKIRIIKSMDEVYSKYIYKEMDICLAMRLHSIILSQIYNIPYIGISYTKKTYEVLDDLNK